MLSQTESELVEQGYKRLSQTAYWRAGNFCWRCSVCKRMCTQDSEATAGEVYLLCPYCERSTNETTLLKVTLGPESKRQLMPQGFIKKTVNAIFGTEEKA